MRTFSKYDGIGNEKLVDILARLPEGETDADAEAELKHRGWDDAEIASKRAERVERLVQIGAAKNADD